MVGGMLDGMDFGRLFAMFESGHSNNREWPTFGKNSCNFSYCRRTLDAVLPSIL